MSTQHTKVRLIQDILKDNVCRHPDKLALICENQRLTYSQIDEMSNRLAHALLKNGIQQGDRILLYLLNSAELVVSIFAALKARAVFSVIDYANTLESLNKIATDCDASVLITYSQLSESIGQLIQNIPSIRFAILTGKKADITTENIISYEAIQSDYCTDALPQNSIDCDLAYLLYTSGSTGKAKGVLTTHKSSLFTIESGVERFALCEDDIHALPLPISFAPGINQLLQIFRAGGTVILEKSFAFPNVILKKMATEKATGLGGVPTVLSQMMQLELSRYDLSSLRYIISSGAALSMATIKQIREKFPETLLYSMYGMAEASFIMCLDPNQIDKRPHSVGKPFPGTGAIILNEKGERLSAGEIGELVVRGGHVRSGYWNDPEASAKHFRPGYLPGELMCYTGDLFKMDEEGYYYFVSRSDEVIKSGAKKVVPKEIESALYKLAGVLEAAAIGIPDIVLGQVIKVFVVLTKEARSKLTADDILQHCKNTLEAFKVPRQIEIRDSLPKTPGGKIKKTELQ